MTGFINKKWNKRASERVQREKTLNTGQKSVKEKQKLWNEYESRKKVCNTKHVDVIELLTGCKSLERRLDTEAILVSKRENRIEVEIFIGRRLITQDM